MVIFDLGGYALTSHTPDPSQEGRLGCLFLFGSESFDGLISPLERGLKGCVTERGADWDEIVLLLLVEVFFGLWVDALGFGGYARA